MTMDSQYYILFFNRLYKPLFIVLIGARLLSATVDPFLLPRPDSFIDKNIVKIAIPEVIGRDTVRQAHFFVHYSQYATNKMSFARVNKLIAVDTSPPFETIWDCSDVPDQDNYNLFFYYKIVNTKGWLISNPDSFVMNCALDRHSALLDRTWHCRRTIHPIKIDGQVTEWDWADSVVFSNNDNRVVAASAWDPEHLYFAVRVYDPDLFPADDNPPDTLPPFMMDGIEVFLDLDHTHASVRGFRDFQIMLPLAGPFHIFNPASYADLQAGKPRPSYTPRTRVKRTGSGFQVELAFLWRELGLKPAAGLSLGINLVNSDREDAAGVVMTASWAGISDLLHHNPSEWADLLLVDAVTGPRQKGLIVLGVLLGLLIVFMVIGRIRKDQRPGDGAAAETSQERVIRRVKTHIINNIGDENLDLKNVAATVELSPDYLRQLFKKVTGENLPDYLNRVRVEKSIELLITTNKRITEIAFEAGFGTYQNFNRVFKDARGCTPSEFRARQT